VTWIQLHQKSFGGDYRGVGKIYIKVVDKFQSVPMKKASMSNVTIRNNKKPASLERLFSIIATPSVTLPFAGACSSLGAKPCPDACFVDRSACERANP